MKIDGEKTIAIGVTGHRFLAEIAKLEAGVRRAMEEIETIFPGKQMLALSALAEGTDRLVARMVLERNGAWLVAVLPLTRKEYEKGFQTAESRFEFRSLLDQAIRIIELPPTPERNEAYEKAGEYVAQRSDVIIALWDGQGVQGEGGTADVVHQAINRGIPVFHIKAGNRKPGTNEPTSLGREQGELMVYNSP
jgi:hypothetical protein